MTPTPVSTPESRFDQFLLHLESLLKVFVPVGEAIANDFIKNKESQAKAAAIENKVNEVIAIGQ